MKRPRWFGGRELPTDEGDAETDAGTDSASDDGERTPRSGSPSRELRVDEAKGSGDARKSLGKRVKRADTPMKRERESTESSPAKPGDDGPKAKRARPANSTGSKRGRRSTGSGSGARAASGEKRESLNQPRRQSDGPEASGRDRAGGNRKSEGGRRQSERPGKAPDRSRSRAGREAGARVRTLAAGSASAAGRGAKRVRGWVASTAPKMARTGLGALASAFSVFFLIFGAVLGVLIAVLAFVARPISYVLTRIRRLADGASRLLTPTRALVIVVAGASVLLGLSQFADYRVITIGDEAYTGVQNVAPAPETGRLETGDAHSYAFVPVAVLCLIALAVAMTGRWRLCRLITVAGVAAIVVAILIDRPAGLDPGEAEFAFEGIRATLLGGFYAQIAAGLLLVCSSTLLARELRLNASAAPAARPSADRSRKSKQPMTRTRSAEA